MGDRRQEIVFIGSDINWTEIKSALDDCLLSIFSFDEIEKLTKLPDPFPLAASEGRSVISSQNIASQRTNESLGEDAKSPCKIYETKTQQGLEFISNPATQLVVWERSISSNLDVWLQNLHPSHLPSLRVLVEPSKFRTAVRLKLGRHIKSDQVLWDLLLKMLKAWYSRMQKLLQPS